MECIKRPRLGTCGLHICRRRPQTNWQLVDENAAVPLTNEQSTLPDTESMWSSKMQVIPDQRNSTERRGVQQLDAVVTAVGHRNQVVADGGKMMWLTQLFVSSLHGASVVHHAHPSTCI